jgi:uncharacterized DUF497 family protein
MDSAKVSGFDWDEGNREKCLRHGLTLVEIEELFRSEPRVSPDIAHSANETRYLAVGRARGGRALFVAFTLRLIDGGHRIRPISARPMHAKEIAHYEKASAAPFD